MKKYCYLLVLLSFVGIPRLVTAQVLQKIPPLPVTKVASNNTSRAIDDRFSNDGWSAANMTREKTIIKDSSVRLATATEQGTAQPVTTLPTTLPTMANKPTRIASFDSTSIQTSAVQPVTLPTNETLYRAVVGEQLVTDVYGNTNRQRVVTYMPVTTTEARDSCEIRTNTTYRPIINSQEAISSPTVTHTLPVTTYRPIVSTPVASHQLSSQPVLAKPLLSRPLLSRPLLSRPILPRSGTSRQVTSYRPILTTGQTESTVAYRPTFEGSQYSAQTFVQPINYSYVQNTSVQGARHAGGYSMGQGLLGQPKVFVTGQPVRNLFRYITP